MILVQSQEIKNILLEIGGKTIPCYKVAKNLACVSVFIESRNCDISNKFLAKEISKQSVTDATWFLLLTVKCE